MFDYIWEQLFVTWFGKNVFNVKPENTRKKLRIYTKNQNSGFKQDNVAYELLPKIFFAAFLNFYLYLQ